jgi:hypothetical protein
MPRKKSKKGSKTRSKVKRVIKEKKPESNDAIKKLLKKVSKHELENLPKKFWLKMKDLRDLRKGTIEKIQIIGPKTYETITSLTKGHKNLRKSKYEDSDHIGLFSHLDDHGTEAGINGHMFFKVVPGLKNALQKLFPEEDSFVKEVLRKKSKSKSRSKDKKKIKSVRGIIRDRRRLRHQMRRLDRRLERKVHRLHRKLQRYQALKERFQLT